VTPPTDPDVKADDLVAAFCEASIRDWTGRAARMLEANPEIARTGFAAAVVLGDVDPVREHLSRVPEDATRRDERTGWTALHLVCASRWHRLDPRRADGMVAVARMLLDAEADPLSAAPGRRPGGGWTPLRCAIAGEANAPIVRLLLERGAVPDDHDLYLAGFGGGDEHETLRLVLDAMPDMSTSTALAAPISTGDTAAVRLLLEAGVEPNRPVPAELFGASHEGEPPVPTVYAAVRAGVPPLLLGLLVEHGADPDAPGGEGRSPIRLAIGHGREDLVEMLQRLGARDDTTEADRLLAACQRGDRADALGRAAAHPDLVDTLDAEQRSSIVTAAESGRLAAVELLLDVGIPADTRNGDGATALHLAAYSGAAHIVRLLLARGADIEARDAQWDSTPLDWAAVGSGERPDNTQDPDWPAVVRLLLDAGASTDGITVDPQQPKQPSPEVAELLEAAMRS